MRENALILKKTCIFKPKVDSNKPTEMLGIRIGYTVNTIIVSVQAKRPKLIFSKKEIGLTKSKNVQKNQSH